jgi:hypothetical protein
MMYESGYGKSYQDFSRNLPDTAEGHDDFLFHADTEYRQLKKVCRRCLPHVGSGKIG